MNLKKKIFLFALISFLIFKNHHVSSQPVDLFNNTLLLTITGNSYSDQTIVLFRDGSTPGFDPNYDAYKLMGNIFAPQLYSIIECCNLSINTMPTIYTNHKVQLGTRFGANTNYTISAEGLYTFGADTVVILEDTQENILIELNSDSTYVFTGSTEDATERFILYFNYPAQLDLKIYLSGAWNGTEMNTTLNSEGLIPLSQPYNNPPWNYSGNESVGIIPNADVVDWVLVEIRDAVDAGSATSSTMVEQQACFVLKNGNIVGTDGNSYPKFKQQIEKNLFVVIHHRNNLPVISAIALIRQAGLYAHNFTDGVDKAYGSDLALKDLGGGTYGLFGGDSNADGFVNDTDKISFWNLFTGKKGYLSSDYNLDGQINNSDKNEVWVLDNNHSTQVP